MMGRSKILAIALLAASSALALLAASPAIAQNAKVSQLIPATLPLTGTELFYVVQGGVSKQTPFSSIVSGSVSLTVGTTAIAGGTSGDIEFNNAGKLGEKGVTGTGSVVLATSPSIASPTVTGAFTATGLVTNGDLVNPSTTVNGQTCTLGSTCTISSAASLVVGSTTITGGTSGDIEFNNAGVLGEKGVTGAGSVVLAIAPTLTLANATGLPNTGLLNSSLTLGSTNVALGATATTIAGLSSVTSTAFAGALTGHASLDLALSSLGTGVQTALGHGVNLQSGLSAVGPVFDVVAAGASPSNSASANVTAFQAAFTAAAAAKGSVHIPCGVYSLNAVLTATVPSKGALAIRGDGQDCVQLSFAAGSNGITITETDQFGSSLASDFSLVTADTTGSYAALTLTSPNTFPAGIGYQTNVIRNVVMRGADAYASTNSDYWGIGINIVNVSYNTIEAGAFWGSGTFGSVGGHGTAVNVIGNVGSSSYSVVTNIHGLQAQYCNIGVNYGEYVQGVTINGGSNFTFCLTGVQVYGPSVGTADQLVVADSQFNCTTAISATQMIGLSVHHNTIISTTAGDVGISGVGGAFSIDHNFIQSQTASSTIGILVNGGGTLVGGSINDNTIQGYGIGVSNTVGTVSLGTVHDNTLYNNTLGYSITTGTNSFIISDPTTHAASTIGTAMPTCAAQYAGARFTVDDQTVTTPLATVNAGSGGGSGWGVALCNGTNYQFH